MKRCGRAAAISWHTFHVDHDTDKAVVVGGQTSEYPTQAACCMRIG